MVFIVVVVRRRREIGFDDLAGDVHWMISLEVKGARRNVDEVRWYIVPVVMCFVGFATNDDGRWLGGRGAAGHRLRRSIFRVLVE